ncbi:MAG: hypothetical protein MZV49_13165 [Rhodopseudomonas palustris]|nr:hypothetical protein [Rhodopseudomonas palustris]
MAALLAAIVANVVGNVSLAEMLTGARARQRATSASPCMPARTCSSSILSLLLARRDDDALPRRSRSTPGPLLAEHDASSSMLAALAAWIVVTLNEFRVAPADLRRRHGRS